MENLKALEQKTYDELAKLQPKDTKICPSNVMPKFKRPKVAAIRSFPACFTQFSESGFQETEEVIDEEQETECIGSPKMDAVVESNNDELDTAQFESVEMDNGARLDLLSELKTSDHDMTLSDFTKGLEDFAEFVNNKSMEDRVKEVADDDFDEYLNELLIADLGFQGGLEGPTVDAFLCQSEFEKQETVVTIDLEKAMLNERCTSPVHGSWFTKRRKVCAIRDFPDAFKMFKPHRADKVANDLKEVVQSDVDLELQESPKDEEEYREENANNSYADLTVVENEDVSVVKTASEDPNNYPKKRKVSAIRDFPHAFKLLNAHNNNKASEENLDHQEAFETETEPEEISATAEKSSATTEKSSACNLRTLHSIYKEVQSEMKHNQDEGKGKGEAPKRKQTEGLKPLTIVLALMAPTKSQRRPKQTTRKNA